MGVLMQIKDEDLSPFDRRSPGFEGSFDAGDPFDI